LVLEVEMIGMVNTVAGLKASIESFSKEQPKTSASAKALAALADAMLAEARLHSSATDGPEAEAAAEAFIVDLLMRMYGDYLGGSSRPAKN
jgi:hypothetical protein